MYFIWLFVYGCLVMSTTDAMLLLSGIKATGSCSHGVAHVGWVINYNLKSNNRPGLGFMSHMHVGG